MIKIDAVKTPDSLLVFTTTARLLRENLGYDAYVYAKQVACGAIVDEACAAAALAAHNTKRCRN